MALFKTTITRVTGRGTHLFDGIGSKMLNGEGVYELTADGVSECSFQYQIGFSGDREGWVRIDAAASTDTISGYVNADYTSTFLTLNVYPDPLGDEPTEEALIRSDHIVIGYTFSGGSILYVRTGSSTERILVSETIDEILSIESTTTEWTDGVDTWRLDVRDGVLYLDQTITPTGFDGDEDTDWGNIWSKNTPDNYEIYSFYYEDGVGDTVYMQFGPPGSRGELNESSVPGVDDFSISGVGTPPVTFESVVISDEGSYDEVQLTLGEGDTIGEGDSPVVSYAKGVNPLQDVYGNDISEFTDEVVSPS